MEKALARQVKRRYPLTTTDLTKPELKALTRILLLDNPPVYQISRPTNTHTPGHNLPNERIKEAIKNLPCPLRRNKLVQMMPKYIGRAAELCLSHNGLNGHVLAHLFDLVRAEVTVRLERMDRSVDGVPMFERKLLRSIQAIRQVWGEKSPEDDNETTPVGAPSPHYNRCEACMLARIVREPLFLRNLRVAILSRTKTRRKSRTPRLLRFVEECIACHEGETFRVLHESSRLAIDFKSARKQAASRRRRGRCSRQQVDRRESAESITVHLDPELHGEFFEHALPKRASSASSRSKDKTPEPETDEIISRYGGISQHESLNETPWTSNLSSDTTAVPSVAPLSPRKPTNTKQTIADTIPSRHMLDWEKVVNHEKSPLDSLANKIEAIELEGPDMSDDNEDADADALATEYRELIGHETVQYSGSDYSQGTTEGAVGEPGRPITTWSLFLSDDESGR